MSEAAAAAAGSPFTEDELRDIWIVLRSFHAGAHLADAARDGVSRERVGWLAERAQDAYLGAPRRGQ